MERMTPDDLSLYLGFPLDLTDKEYSLARTDLAVFCKTREKWGCFSNMANGWPIWVESKTSPYQKAEWKSSEALYQACRFPDHEDIQRMIQKEPNPFKSKLIAKSYRHLTRPDWGDYEVIPWGGFRVVAMMWTLRMKAHNVLWVLELESSMDLTIVEKSHNDPFWGAVPNKHGDALIGKNVLGQLLMRVRTEGVASIAPPPEMSTLPFDDTLHIVS